MKTPHLFCLLVSLLFAVSVSAAENTNNRLITGTFGVAWLDSDGLVRLYDGENVTEPVKTKVYAILAADLLEEGTDQLIYLDDTRKALHIHSFKTDTTIGPFGHNVRTMAAGRFSADESFPSLFACTFTGNSFRWTKEIMDGGWIALPGSFEQASRGNFDPRSDTDEFAVVSEGNVYIYSTKWNTYSKVLEGKNIVAVLAGNFTESTGDDIAMCDKEGGFYLLQNKTVVLTTGPAPIDCLSVGRNPDRLDTLYVIYEQMIYRYDPEIKTITGVLPINLGYTNLIVSDEQVLFATDRRKQLWKIQDDSRTSITASLTKFDFWLNDKRLAQYRSAPVPFAAHAALKPYIETLKTPSGKNILRASPHDHLHHHALMYALKVGDTNFWEELVPNAGKQMTNDVQYIAVANSPTGRPTVKSEINWRSNTQSLLLETREISVTDRNTVSERPDAVLLDWQSTLRAPEETVLGGAGSGHYYGLGMRFVQEMDKGGRFFNSTGTNDGEIVRGDERLTRCRWMGYTAKVDGEPVTVAVFDHPSNPVPMTVFTMGDGGGAFAYMSATMNMHREPIRLAAGQTFAVKYRVVVWDGEVPPEVVEERYREFVR